MKKMFAVLLLVCAGANAAESFVPVHEEPRHRVLIETPQHRVLSILIRPGDTTLYHRHAWPTFYVYLQLSKMRIQVEGEEWTVQSPGNAQPGDISVNDDQRDDPVVHRVGNIGTADFRLILIQSERVEPPAGTRDLLERLPGEPGTSSEYFAQSRISLGPGQTLSWDGVNEKVYFVLVSDTPVVMHDRGDERFSTGLLSTGDVFPSEGGLIIENRGEETATIIAVAVR